MTAARVPVLSRLAGVQVGVPEPPATAAFLRDGLQFSVQARDDEFDVLCAGDYGDPEPQQAITLVRRPSLELIELRFTTTPVCDLEALAHAASAHGATEVTVDAGRLAYRDPGATRVACGRFAVAPGPLPVSSLRPRRLGHANLKVRDPAAVTRFWVRAMGMCLSEQIGDDLAFLRLEAEHHNLGLRVADAPMLHHLGFEVPGWDAYRPILDQLAEAGYRAEFGPGRHGVGRNLFTYVVDPSSGLRLELFADMARVRHQEDPETPPIRWRAEDRMTRTLNVWGSAPPPASFLA
ncbi:MAG: VOC family protein [Solirubrobacteraceae bacterium]